jgi:predicted nuclease with TOPRIM domain
MKDKPLILSLLVGLIMVLVIAGVSLLVRINALSGSERKSNAEKMAISEQLESLKKENSLLTEKNKGLIDDLAKANIKSDELKTELAKLEKLKDKLEENLKDELIKQDSNVKN